MCPARCLLRLGTCIFTNGLSSTSPETIKMEVTVPGGNGSSTRAESPATPALIMKLPSEILTEIFAGLTIKDMFSVVRVCKEWQQLGERGMLSSKLQVDMRHLAIKPNTVNRYIQKMKTCFFGPGHRFSNLWSRF